MKTLILSTIFSLVLIFTNQSIQASKSCIKTDTLTVRGNCGQCKERIEEAAYVKGVKQATWDKKTQILQVVYNPNKTNLKLIEKAISEAGHDTPNFIASESDYKKLPSCCAYRTGKCDHD
jgi:mercuric ion binding protein